MGLLTKLKSLLGFEDDRSQVRRGESGVTIERDPDESAEPDAEVESAVKGVDAGGEESTSEPATEREATATGPGSDETDAGSPTTTPDGIEEAESGARDAEATDSEVEADEPATDEVEAGQTEASQTETEPSLGEGEADESEAEPAAEETAVEEATTDETTTEEAITDETTTDEATTDETAAAAAGEPLEDVKGIGPAYAERLRDAGVADVADLAGADADRLAEETDLSAKRISRWIERAGAR